ncbi:MAG: hypothetical protein Tsb009_07710 [Planctomycetaceae bacterium]
MFTGEEITEMLERLEFTHIVWVPDSTLGQWEFAFQKSDSIHVVNVCREGEAWAVAAGLYLGGARPIVIIQCTGLFESGDALRNALHDYKLPLFSIIGYRSYHNQETLPGDTALKFTEPVLNAWNLNYRLITASDQRDEILEHCLACRKADQPGVILLAEGRA